MKTFLSFINIFILLLCLNCKPKSTESAVTPHDTISESDYWLTYQGDKEKPNIVFVSGDEEYRSEEALPLLASLLNRYYGFNCTVLFAQDPSNPGVVDANYGENIPGLEQLKDADLMILFTRFRALPDDQMRHIDNYLKSGKPVIGIRTATHAFNFTKDHPDTHFAHYGNYHESDDKWNGGFGRLVLGEKWIAHHGHHKHQSARGIIAPGAESHPILNGIENGAIWGPTDVYQVRLPLPDDAQSIILGQVVNRSGEYMADDPLYGMREIDVEIAGEDPKRPELGSLNDPMMPIAWTKSYKVPDGKMGRAFTSTIGSSTDLLDADTRRLLVNATHWLLNIKVPTMAKVDLLQPYNPTPYMFVDDLYWDEKNLKISDIKSLY